jgi:hypothetical protein
VNGWLIEVETDGGLLAGALPHAPSGVHAASAIVDHRAYLPGSAVRGALRQSFRRFVEARHGRSCEFPEPCECVSCRVFGAVGRPGRLRVRSAFAERFHTADRTRIAIDRRRRSAVGTGALFTERRLTGRFSVRLEHPVPLGEPDAGEVRTFLEWLRHTGFAVGRSRSTGAGRLRITGIRELEPASALPAPRRSNGDTRRLGVLTFTTTEPVRLAGVRPREFLREVLPVVPVSTVRGALGWGLVERGAPDAATDCFEARPIRLTNAVAGDRLPPGAWLGSARCGACDRAFDRTIATVAEAFGAVTDVARCSSCGELLRPATHDSPPHLLLGHTAIDPRRGRAASGQLYHEVVVAPGTTFRALAEATHDQLELLAGLGEVLVGGSRARGLGRCRVAVVTADGDADTDERLAGQHRALRAAAPEVPDDVAVLGVMNDAWVPDGLDTWLRARGVDPVTAWTASVVRGGFDERSGAPRPVRRLVASGSWVVVRGDRRALATIERDRADPDGPWLRVRDDLEGLA